MSNLVHTLFHVSKDNCIPFYSGGKIICNLFKATHVVSGRASLNPRLASEPEHLTISQY